MAAVVLLGEGGEADAGFTKNHVAQLLLLIQLYAAQQMDGQEELCPCLVA